ncbi:MAG: CRISPR-associated endoribonuclease Cas6, partial [Candidatus Thermoplasmatota archaeon]
MLRLGCLKQFFATLFIPLFHLHFLGGSFFIRAEIDVKKISDGFLPFDYQYALSSMLYGKLAEGNVSLANQAHSHQGFKWYNFSNLILDGYTSNENGLSFKEGSFILSSPDKDFVKAFAEGLLKKPEFNLFDQNFLVSSIEILDKPDLKDKKMFKTLSPVFVKTKRKKDDKLVEWDLYPTDGKFHENVHQNLVDRYKEYYGHPPDEDFFEITDVENFKSKKVR